jgi:N-acetylglucosaminyldiphosphoundecaprenol N-acetyl-beta-D-mannosaminyltransferase
MGSMYYCDKPRERIAFRNVLVDSLDWDGALETIVKWAERKESRFISICNVHVVVTAWEDPLLCNALSIADMVTPDGMPLVWHIKRRGFKHQKRIDGPNLMWRYLALAQKAGQSVYLFGSTEETLERLSARIRFEYPLLRIAGACSPPFRPLTSREDEEIVARINDTNASVVFVGLGCPKQELWMAGHKGKINAVMIGVGAAFDFYAGNVKRAPEWMQANGLEWLYRLASEPGRLWKRYLTTNTRFLSFLLLNRQPKSKELHGPIH